jgi:hypothetical protein
VISTGECNTSVLIMDEEVRAWQREEALDSHLRVSAFICGFELFFSEEL